MGGVPETSGVDIKVLSRQVLHFRIIAIFQLIFVITHS